jgi:uncharacterized protein
VVSDDLILPWLERVREDLPGLELFDAHTHIGTNDPDGYHCTREELMDALEVARARAVVFAMHEPGGYAAANDMIMRESAASGGRLVPFCRLDPRRDPVAEAERCLDAGARGIKLHPRAEGFTLDDPAVADIVALAHERRVCVLIHAGRGIPALGRHTVDLCERFPDARLILAHAGISDLAWIWRRAAELPNLFFDTAWWTPDDLLALFALVPPGQILLGSDAPYGSPALGAALPLRYALQAGLTADQVEWVFGRQLERLLTGEERLDLGPPPGEGSLPGDIVLARVYSYLLSALGQMLRGIEPEETLGLVQLACEVGDDAPQASVCSSVLALIEERARYAAEPDPGGPPRFAPGIHLVLVAACVCRTPDVPHPPDPVPVDVGERAAGR